jgi:hypothetical protein
MIPHIEGNEARDRRGEGGMITTFSTWSTDISKAPKGRNVETTRLVTVKGETVERTISAFVADQILALTSCGMIIQSQWVPPRLTATGSVLDGDRWSGFNRGDEPVAWALWPDAEALEATIAAKRAADDRMAKEALFGCGEDA